VHDQSLLEETGRVLGDWILISMTRLFHTEVGSLRGAGLD
jgi:hypothetical protein